MNELLTLRIPWNKKQFARCCNAKIHDKVEFSDALLQCYVEFFVREVVSASYEVTTWDIIDDNKIQVTVKTDGYPQHLFVSQVPEDWQVKLWMNELIWQKMKGKVHPSFTTCFIRYWCKSCLNTNINKRK